MNIKSIAIYSDADKEAPHVLEADQAFYVGRVHRPKVTYVRIESSRFAKAKKSMVFTLVTAFYLRMQNLQIN